MVASAIEYDSSGGCWLFIVGLPVILNKFTGSFFLWLTFY
jgi:hypothetical protein